MRKHSPRIRLAISPFRQIDPAWKRVASRLCDGVPVQRQIGYTIVCGRKFLITPDVLLPGPEIDLVLAAFFENAQGATTVVDLCTGCGVLASVIGTTCPSSRVYATDISSGALDVARQNVGSDNVTLLLGDLFDPLRDTNVAPVDALVSNPPYCRTEDIDRLPKQLRDHTPRIAIDGGLDGYAFHRRIIRESAAFVRPRGIIVLENETGQSDEICRMLKAEGWSVVDVRRNDKGEERVVVARRMA